ncbi:hypothetical protein ABLE68_04710 [Nocardioides sp. CN2-186]|uniref:hypothetical protein n=1 Tax=Nocardioides tweenelious TaxID=3156607 RepID=UPI0032B3716D
MNTPMAIDERIAGAAGPSHAELRNNLHWETALDRLELDVILAERMLDDPTRPAPEPWDETQLEGPIPSHLRQRALDIRARQRQAQQALQVMLGTIARHHDFARRVDRATGRPDHAVYLDLQA